MKKNVIYARVSTEDKQDTQRQINELKQRVVDKSGNSNFDLEIIEEKISGYKLLNGSKLESLLEKILDTPQDYEMLYVWEISRLGRNPLETRTRIEKLLESGVKIYVETLNTILSNDNLSMNSAMTKMILLLLLEFSHIESQTTKLRIRSGLLHSARSGKVGGGINIPYGYFKDDDKNLVVCPEEKKIIKKIYNLYSEGYGIRRISTILNNENVPTRYNKIHGENILKFKTRPVFGKNIKWSDKQIHDILRNTLYIGERKFKGEVLDCPAIIDKELFYSCENIRLHKNSKGNTKNIFLLKDLLKCNCGRNFVGVNKHDEKIYKCSSRLRTSTSCGCKGVNLSLIESVIFHQVLLSSQLINFVRSNKDFKDEIALEIKMMSDEIESLKFKNIELDKSQSRLLDQLLQNTFPEDKIRNKSEIISKEIKKNNKKIKALHINLINKKKGLIQKAETNYELINSYKNDRGFLKKLFSEIVRKVDVISFDNSYFMIDLTMKILDKNEVIFRLKLDVASIRKKNKRYIYSVESTIIKVHRFGEVIPVNFYREDYLKIQNCDFKNLMPPPFKIESRNLSQPIFIDNDVVRKNDHLYGLDKYIDQKGYLSTLKLFFIERFSTYFVFPIELKQDQLIQI